MERDETMLVERARKGDAEGFPGAGGVLQPEAVPARLAHHRRRAERRGRGPGDVPAGVSIARPLRRPRPARHLAPPDRGERGPGPRPQAGAAPLPPRGLVPGLGRRGTRPFHLPIQDRTGSPSARRWSAPCARPWPGCRRWRGQRSSCATSKAGPSPRSAISSGWGVSAGKQAVFRAVKKLRRVLEPLVQITGSWVR